MRGVTCVRQAGSVTPSPVHTEETEAQRAEWLGPGRAHRGRSRGPAPRDPGVNAPRGSGGSTSLQGPKLALWCRTSTVCHRDAAPASGVGPPLGSADTPGRTGRPGSVPDTAPGRGRLRPLGGCSRLCPPAPPHTVQVSEAPAGSHMLNVTLCGPRFPGILGPQVLSPWVLSAGCPEGQGPAVLLRREWRGPWEVLGVRGVTGGPGLRGGVSGRTPERGLCRRRRRGRPLPQQAGGGALSRSGLRQIGDPHYARPPTRM